MIWHWILNRATQFCLPATLAGSGPALRVALFCLSVLESSLSRRLPEALVPLSRPLKSDSVILEAASAAEEDSAEEEVLELLD